MRLSPALDTAFCSRAARLRWDGKGAKRPGLARMICSCEYRFDEVQALRVEPLSGSLRVADF
jgi:hypothetical protein